MQWALPVKRIPEKMRDVVDQMYTHNKSRVEAAPEVEPFQYILDNTREHYYFSSFGSAKIMAFFVRQSMGPM